MTLTSKLKQDSGYRWVMDRLEPASPFGRALLRSPRWYGPGEEEELEAEFSRLAALLPPHPAQDAVLHQLAQFRDVRNTFRRDGTPMDAVELFELKHFLLTLERLCEAASALPPLDGLTLAPLPAALDLLDPSGRRLAPFTVESAPLTAIRAEKAELEAALRHSEGDAREALLAKRRAVVEREDAAELEARRSLTAALMALREDFLAAMDAVGRLDLLLAKAKLARTYGCVRPELTQEKRIDAAGLIHPQVAAHVERFTPVSLTLERGSTVITGANMGGKSVSLRSVVLNLLLVHTGFFPFAARFATPLFHRVALICSDGQDAEQGLSSFGAEVTELNALLQEMEGGFCFAALDEFARGTNPQEGAALARALAAHLNGLDCVALLTTHYDGVAAAAGRHYQVAGLSTLEETARAGDLLSRLPALMDYRLLPAPPDAPCPKDALRVCRLLGLSGAVLDLFEENH